MKLIFFKKKLILTVSGITSGILAVLIYSIYNTVNCVPVMSILNYSPLTFIYTILFSMVLHSSNIDIKLILSRVKVDIASEKKACIIQGIHPVKTVLKGISAILAINKNFQKYNEISYSN